jgi:hypothetical protein
MCLQTASSASVSAKTADSNCDEPSKIPGWNDQQSFPLSDTVATDHLNLIELYILHKTLSLESCAYL